MAKTKAQLEKELEALREENTSLKADAVIQPAKTESFNEIVTVEQLAELINQLPEVGAADGGWVAVYNQKRAKLRALVRTS